MLESIRHLKGQALQDRPEEYERARGKYIIDNETMKILPKHSVIMHPLPRVDEVNSSGLKFTGPAICSPGSPMTSFATRCSKMMQHLFACTEVMLAVLRGVWLDAERMTSWSDLHALLI